MSTPVFSGTVAAASGVLSSELGTEYVLLNLRNGTYYGLDAVGSDIWKQVQHPIDVADLCRAIVEIYEVDPERCRQDVAILLGELVESGLVVRTE